MTDRPKRNAVANREATDKLLDKRKRRSSAQVQQEQKSAAATAAASEEAKINLAFEKKQRIAAFEDALRKEDQQRNKKKARVDLVPHHPVSFPLFSPSNPNIHAVWIGKTNAEATCIPNEGIHACDKGTDHSIYSILTLVLF
jgi:hypothetical protein